MSAWEPAIGRSDEWYTPRHVFEALCEVFDLDVAAPHGGPRRIIDRCMSERGHAVLSDLGRG